MPSLNKLLKVDIDELRPSDAFTMMQDAVVEALGSIRDIINREAARGTLTPRRLSRLEEKRDELNARLNDLILRDMDTLDNHKRVKEITDALLKLAGSATKAANAMRKFRETIDKATKIVGFADQALGIALAVVV